jgi:hypothetical protein
MIIPAADAEIGFEVPDDLEPAGGLTWRSADLTVELSEEQPTDPLSRPFAVDDWRDGIADAASAAWTVIEIAPDGMGSAARNENASEIRMILFSHDDGDYRAARIVFATPPSRARLQAITVRVPSRGRAIALADLLGL